MRRVPGGSTFHLVRARNLGIETLDLIVVCALLGAAELAVAVGRPDGPTLALWAFPLAWTLPLLLRRRFPSVAALTVLAALALEAFVAQEATESLVVLVAVVLAFWVAGTIPDRGRAVAVGIAGALLSAVVVAENPGPVTATDVVFVAIVSALPFLAGMLLRSRERHADELRRRASDLERDREERARVAIEEERARIARELHDVVGHAVGVMTVQAGAARLLVDRDPERAWQSMLAVEEAGRQALAEMRRMLAVLRADGKPNEFGPQPGLADLEQLVMQVRDAGLPVEITVEGEPSRLPPGLDLAAYRIVQEALTNVRKHAGDARTLVHLRYERDGLDLAVENEGALLRGGAESESGHGLIGMRERAGLYGGELTAGPRPEGGFAVRVHLPVATDAS
ncbi:MAG TPA: sensor histidine kinase [Gaiellaceae bacterium]|jgi:signal transduction histidine kinase